jgi:hypothetical protein
MSVLRSMTCLETLDLRDVLPSPPVERLSPLESTSILLPHLTRIKLECDLRVCVYVLNQLAYPTTTSIILVGDIDAWNFQLLASDYLPSIAGLGEIFSKSGPFRHFTAHYNAQAIQLTNSALEGEQAQRALWYNGFPVDVTLNVRTGFMRVSVFAELLPRLWESIPMIDVESLHVREDWDSLDIWTNLFDRLTGVPLKRLMVMGGNSGIKFLRAFSAHVPALQLEASEGPSRLPCLASLRELSVGRWDFKERLGRKTCFEGLKACLKDRKKHNVAIDRLFLLECFHVTAADVKELRDIVAVTWDGWEGSESDLFDDTEEDEGSGDEDENEGDEDGDESEEDEDESEDEDSSGEDDDSEKDDEDSDEDDDNEEDNDKEEDDDDSKEEPENSEEEREDRGEEIGDCEDSEEHEDSAEETEGTQPGEE